MKNPLRLLLLQLVLLGALADATFAEVPQTMRLDYFHSGDHDEEHFSLDRLVLEPLPFSGNLAQPVDTTLRGKYAFEIHVPGADSVAWSRSFSSIYGEWETTGEAREIRRSFHESVRFPAPEGEFDLVMKKRNAENGFDEVWRIRLDASEYLVHREQALYREHVVPIEINGPSPEKVDVLLLGDGYTPSEQDRFLATARELTDLLLTTPPFDRRRTDFNVWALAPPAAQSGVSRPSTGLYRDSPLGATYDAFRSERYVLTFQNQDWRRVASSVPYDFVEILTNSETYGGGGIYGLYSTAAANGAWAGYLFVHEFAHHFAGLADEYYTSSVAYEPPTHIVEPYEPNVTALLDPSTLKWRHLVEPETPMPTPWPKDAFEKHSLAYQARRADMRARNVPESEMNALFTENQRIVEGLFSAAPYRDAIGAFEGAMYQAAGYYRSEMNCIMFTRTTDFCRVCSDAVEAVIDEYTQPAP